MQKTKLNLPNKLTLLRLILVLPLLVLVTFSINFYHLNGWRGYNSTIIGILNLFILIIFIGAMITDYFDGKIARERNLVTDFGKLWDPIADKVITNIVLIYLAIIHFVPVPILFIFILRDLIVAGFRNIMSKHNVGVEADFTGKLKTLLLSIGIVVTLFLGTILKMTIKAFSVNLFYDYIISILVSFPITIAAFLSIYSGYIYYKKAKPFILTK
ncbi:CDP-diacylglycerol--glycerol-3-phosphate 3-phosphatidyltransferase [Mycoplasmopsis glycophila]|uniref:CDP-diacylglycerol--glycerol-3-phosphate 3-phosphatidyltransferase n=1 Tax=Mycoplasmopsis glycophila TaxID=171285 RepID=A0A449AVS7_9BACT|nr:CDP-diacylglycerol--glycerol-3-phosphate 3-phosphatidyltransferase [Mycoplasmopsis glycophila]VEU70687.1 CDP-diacylglycerol--glycerol-3-phosphate 3-phosphatidyltransferase [Mycoplasmopsis glycophila]